MRPSKTRYHSALFPSVARRTADRLATRQGIISLLVLYSALIVVLAVYMTHPIYKGRTYELIDFDVVTVAILVGFATLPALWLPLEIKRPSEILFWFICVFVYVPGVIMPYISRGNALRFVPLLVVMHIGLLLMRLSYKLPQPAPSLPTASKWIRWVILSVVVICAMGLVQLTIGFSPRTPFKLGHHGARAAYKADLATLNGPTQRFVTYAFMWLKNVIFPSFVAIGIARRDWRPTLIGLLGLGVVYVTAGHRSALFTLVIIAGLTILFNLPRNWFGPFILGGLSIVICGSILLNSAVGFAAPTSTLRRLLLAQGMHVGTYYDFFSDPAHPFVYLSNRSFVFFLKYPYNVPIPNLIGSIYYPVGEIHANANFWANGYAMFGLTGVLGFSVLYAGVFYCYDIFAQYINPLLSWLLLSGLVIVATNTSPITVVITHGFGLLIILVAIFAFTGKKGSASLGDLVARARNR